MHKPRLSFLSIFNMSFGFLGIQIGFALQGANMSRIFQTLGAGESDIPGLWLAAPLTGLLVQPIIGYMSDGTWSRWGRRKPYFFVGAVLSCIALIFMPQVSALWMAAGMLCLLDASINISMEPFRALVADKLPDEQRTQGFAVQSVLIGGGAVLASLLPNIFAATGVSNTAAAGVIPDTVKYAFYVGAVCFMAAILYTNLTTEEYAPENMDEFLKEKENSTGLFNMFSEIFASIRSMPITMMQVAVVQLFTWFALFAMWSNTTPAVTSQVFHATDPTSAAYNEGANYLNKCWAMFNIVCCVMGFILPTIAKNIGRRMTHLIALCIGGTGLIWVYFITEKEMLLVAYGLVGIAWSSILCMPYAMFSGSLPAKKVGIYMGLFNMFICIPQIIASLGGLNFLSHKLIGPNAIHGILLAGGLLIIAGFCSLLVKDAEGQSYREV